MQKRSPSVWFALFLWSVLILRFGYRFGTGDQVELLPYTLFLSDASLYAKDFFIQGLHATVPNERTVMANLLLPFVDYLELIAFLGQMLCTVFLVMGLEKIALRFIQNRYWAWVAVATALIPLNDFGLGNVEVYSECLQAGGVATALIVWAMNYFLDKRWMVASLLMTIATFIQLLDGLDVMLVLSAILLFAAMAGQVKWSIFLRFIGLFGATAGVYLLFILLQKSGKAQVAPEFIFEVMFKFRHPHHFIFASFSTKKVMVFLALTIIGMIYFRKVSKPLFQFLFIGSLGLLFYIVATDVFHFTPIANFQFYKVSQWMKFFGVVALLAVLPPFLGLSIHRFQLHFERSMLLAGTLFSFMMIMFLADKLPYQVPVQILGLKEREAIIRIAEEIKMSTPQDAVFIQPFENTELKFYGQRSSYVEFKANVRHQLFVQEWYRRIGEVYGVNKDSEAKGFALQQLGNTHFEQLSAAQLIALKYEGVTHLLYPIHCVPALGTLVVKNEAYAVYQL
jgi:hypothetical protein